MRLVRFYKPVFLLAVPLIVSLLVWAIPGSGTYLRGFAVRSSFGPGAALVLVGWYLACVLVVIFGGAVGRAIPAAASLASAELSRGFERRLYIWLTVFAFIGVAGAYYTILGSVSIIQAVESGQANNLSEVLLSGSNIGTLRYTAIVSAPIGVFLALRKKTGWFLAGINLLLLLGVVLLSSRLSLIMATSILIFLLVHDRPGIRVRLGPVLAGSVLLFGLLAVFNYTRNSNFYRLFGVDNPIAMNLYQIATYVGAPAQVSVGVANGLFRGAYSAPGDPVASLQAIIPTFFQEVKGDKTGITDPALYGYQVDIAPNLNSNSSFADTYARYGWWGLLYTLIILGIAAAGFAHFARFGSILSVVAGVLGYGFLEYWRGFFFNQGNIVFILIAVGLASLLASIGGSTKESPRLSGALGAQDEPAESTRKKAELSSSRNLG